MIVFPCTRCGQKLQIPDDFAGKPVRCSVCKQVLTGPAAVAVAVAADAAVPDVAGNPSSLAQAGLNGGVTLGSPAPSDTEDSAKGSPSQRDLRETLARGSSSIERYRVLNEIARGGMGAVLRAADCDIRREVAVKYLLDQADERKKARFVEEAQITGQLEHPNIVPIHELGIDRKKRLFFSMKMVRGRSLQQVLSELREYPHSSEKEFTLTRLLGIFVNVCHALAYAHSRRVVHRDLKPANIMIGDFGEVYVMDWGLAKVLPRDVPQGKSATVIKAATPPSFSWAEADSGAGSATVRTNRQSDEDKTVDGTILGTPLYMPPEQAMGDIASIDQRSDIYSLGAILYEVLTLQPPVEKDGGHMAILMRVSLGEIKAPALRTPDRARAGKIPRELAAVAMKALAKRPHDRYQEVAELRRDIERFVEGRSVSAKEDTKLESVRKFVRRNKAFSAAATAAAAAIAVVLLASSWLNYKARRRAEDAYRAYLQEQDDKRIQARKSVPAFVEAAHAAAERKKFGDALAQVNVALDYDPEHAPARLLKGQLLIARKEFAGARQELERYLKSRPGDSQSAKLVRLCATGKPDDPAVAAELADILIRQEMSVLAVGLLRAPEKLLAIYQQKIDKAWTGLGQRLTMDADGRLSLNFDNCPQVLDLVPLKGMPLRELIVWHSQIRDLSPLKGMPLTRLYLNDCPRIADLSPLKGMKLTSLVVQGWGDAGDFSIFKGMPLSKLDLQSAYLRNTDLGFLRDAPLTDLSLGGSGELTHLGALKNKILSRLSITNCPKLKDLAALEGMPLTALSLDSCGLVSGLKPIRGMPMTQLDLRRLPITDLTSLQGMPLTHLILHECPVRDLEPLRGMALTYLDIQNCSVLKDVIPLTGMRLTHLNLSGCSELNDLTPLRGMMLPSLGLSGCNRITDLTPLQEMKLEAIWFEPRIVKTGVDALRKMRSLTKINERPTEVFWKQYDAGEFTK